MLEDGCRAFSTAVWERFEFEFCPKLTSWKSRTNELLQKITRMMNRPLDSYFIFNLVFYLFFYYLVNKNVCQKSEYR